MNYVNGIRDQRRVRVNMNLSASRTNFFLPTVTIGTYIYELDICCLLIDTTSLNELPSKRPVRATICFLSVFLYLIIRILYTLPAAVVHIRTVR